MAQDKEGQQSVQLNKEQDSIDKDEPAILVYKRTSGRSLVIPLQFNNHITKATVDTAAMVTLADYIMSQNNNY